MSEFDIVRKIAEQTLVISTPSGGIDRTLWDRSRRLIRNIEHICQLPELNNTVTGIDRFCLGAAAYFSDAGLARHLRSEKVSAKAVNCNVNGDNLLELCAKVVEEVLGEHINGEKIEKINRIIAESSNYLTRMTEAMILSDARNLDDMGVVGLLGEFGRYALSGKGVGDMLGSWKKKIDYGYWEARLKESFRFEQVRKVAEQRLAIAEHFINQLKVEIEAQDLEELSIIPTTV